MRLRGLVFEGFAAFERIEVDLCDDQGQPLDVVLFVGESGQGKTALLRGISGVLAEAAGGAPELGPDDIRNSATGASRCRVVFDDLVEGALLKVIAEKEIGQLVRGLPPEAFERWRTTIVGESAPRAAFSITLPDEDDAPPDSIAAPPDDDGPDPLFEWFFGLRGGPHWDTALRALDRVLWPASFDHVMPEGEIVFSTGPASHLGDGFDSVLVMTLELLRLSTDRATDNLVYVIDDIDKHLHPKWQSRLIGDLRRAFPRVQLIASTQSPWLAASVEPWQVFRLEGGGVTRVSERIEKTAPVTNVMDAAFGAPEMPGPRWVNTPPLAVRRDVLRGLADDLTRGSAVYVLPQAVHTRDVRDAFGELVLTTPDQGPGYVFFIDYAPGTSWGHACEYVFRLRDGRLHRQKGIWPPKNLEQLVQIAHG